MKPSRWFRCYPVFSSPRLPARWIFPCCVAFSMGPLAGDTQAPRDVTWTGGGTSSNWGTRANWGGTSLQDYDILHFAGSTQLTANNNLSAGKPRTLTFDAGAGAFTLTGNSIVLSGNLTNNSSNLQTINLAMSLAATRTFNAASGDLAVGGVVSGAGGLTKTGSNELTLSGSNTYTGVTTISAGVLSVATIGNGGVAGNLGKATNAASKLVLDGGTLQYTGATASSDRNFTLSAGKTSTLEVTTHNLTLSGASAATTGALTKSGVGTLTLSGVNLHTGLTTVSAGTIAYGASNVLGSGDLTVDGASSILDLFTYSDAVGKVTLSNGGTIAGTSGSLQSADFEMMDGMASAILAGTGVLNKTTGGTVTLSGDNTYSGATTVSAGVLKIQHSNGLGSTAGGTTVSSGAALEVEGNLSVGNEALALTGTLRNNSGDNDYGGLLTLGSGSLITSSGGMLTLSNTGTITGAGAFTVSGTGNTTVKSIIGSNINTLAKSGTGILTLNGANTYTGATAITAGTLRLGGDHKLPDGTDVTVSAGATLDLNGYSDTIASLLGAGNVVLGNNAASNLNLAVGSGTFSGIISGAGELKKTGTGTLTLTGANTFTGDLHIENGTLSINSVKALTSAQPLGMGPAGKVYLGLLGSTAGTLNYTGAAGTLYQSIDVLGDDSTIRNSGSGMLTIRGTIEKQSGTMTLDGGTNGITLKSAILGANLGITATNVTLGGFLDPTTALDVSGPITLGDATGAVNQTVAGLTNVTNSTTAQIMGGNLTTVSYLEVNLVAGSNEFSGLIGGSNTTKNKIGLVKSGAGTLVLSGADSNSYTGLTVVNEGELQLSKTNNTLTAIGGDVQINGGTLRFMQGKQIASTSNVTLNGGSLLFNTTSGVQTVKTFTNTGGTFITGVNTLTCYGTGNLMTWAGGTNTISANGATEADRYLITKGSNTVEGAGTLIVTAGGSGLEFGGTESPTITLNSSATNSTDAGRLNLNGNVTVLSTLTDGTARILSGGSETYAGFIDLKSAERTFTVADGLHATDMLISARITNGGLIKAGLGTLELSAANDYDGGTTINAGILEITHANALGSEAATVNTGGELELAGNINVANALILAGGEICNLTGENTFSGAVTLMADSLVDADAGTLTIATVIDEIDGSYGFTKVGGGIVVLTAANTYSGVTHVTEGILRISDPNALGTTDAGTTVHAGGELELSGGINVAEAFTLHGGEICNLSGSNEFSGVVTLTADSLVDSDAGTLTVSHAIGEDGGAFGLTKIGPGTVELTGASTYTGATIVNEGILTIGAGGSLSASGSVAVNNPNTGAGTAVTLNLPGTSANTIGSLSGTIAPAASGTNTATLQNGGQLLTVNQTTAGTYEGTITGGGGFTKDGGAALTLTGASDYSGATTVSAGTLLVNNTTGSGTGSGAVSVTAGATLGGIGRLAGAADIHGTLAPGDASPGTLTFDSSLTYHSGSIFEWDLHAAREAGLGETPNQGAYDKLEVGGEVTGTSVFQIALGTNSYGDAFWDTGKTWTDIFTTDGSTAIAGWSSRFSSISGADIVWNSSQGDVEGQGYFTLGGNTLSWTAVPEPSSALAGLLLGAGLLRRRRQR